MRRIEFTDSIDDTEAAIRYRALKKAAVPPPPKETPDQTSVALRERLIGEFLHANPAETRTNAVEAVYRANAGLYEKCRLEETVSNHGRTLSQIYARAHGSFGVDQQGNEMTKADIEALVMRKAAMVLSKGAHGTTLDDAIGAVFRSDPNLYESWRVASRA